jgi:hypothetical protein
VQQFQAACCMLLQVCFLFQEADLFLQASRGQLRSPWAAVQDLAVALLLGKALPILVNIFVEARARAAFLRARCGCVLAVLGKGFAGV